MPSSFDIIVYYQNREHLFHIGPNLNSLQDLKNSISNYFHININDFIIEVYDDRYNLCITLDKYYFEDLLSDTSSIENNTVTVRLRSQKQTAFNAMIEDDKLSIERNVELNDSLIDHVVIWLDPDFDSPEKWQRLKHRLEEMIQPKKSTLISEMNDDININSLIGVDNEDYSVAQNYVSHKLFIFSDIQNCLTFINRISADEKAIFLIINELWSRISVAQIFDNMHIHKIYILRYFLRPYYDLVLDIHDYHEKINIFDHDEDLFSRLLRDVGEYYKKKASNSSQNPRLRLLYSTWAKDFYEIGDKNDNLSAPSSELRSTQEQISELEKLCENNFDEDF